MDAALAPAFQFLTNLHDICLSNAVRDGSFLLAADVLYGASHDFFPALRSLAPQLFSLSISAHTSAEALELLSSLRAATHLTLLDLTVTSIKTSGQAIMDALHPLTTLEDLTLTVRSVQEQPPIYSKTPLPQLTSLRFVGFRQIMIPYDDLALAPSRLRRLCGEPQLSTFEELAVVGAAMSIPTCLSYLELNTSEGWNVEGLAHHFKRMASLRMIRILDLACVQTASASYAIMYAIDTMPCLEELNCFDFDWDREAVASFCAALKTRHQLKRLSLLSAVPEGCSDLLAHALESLVELRSIRLGMDEYDARDMRLISDALRKLPCLVLVELVQYDTDQGFAEWASMLEDVPHVRVLED